MIIKFQPIFLEKIWGGSQISNIYGIDSKDIGECWGISGHNLHSNLIEHDSFKGYNLRRLFEEKRELFGRYKSEEFPILIKYIDAKLDLSIQVHPNDEYASLNENSFGKDECWYILEANSDSKIIIGHNADSNKIFSEQLKNKEFDRLLNSFYVKRNDYFYLPAGTIHSIGKDIMLLEVSQSSNITYRLYDYDRLENGHKREIQTKKALEVITIPDCNIIDKNPDNKFTFEINDNIGRNIFVSHKYGDYISILEGQGYIGNYALKKGDFFMVSSDSGYSIEGKIRYHLSHLV